MLIAFAPGSDGEGEERYSVYLPFYTAPEHTLDGDSGDVSCPFGSYQARIRKLHFGYSISVGPFGSHEEARSYVSTVKACLLWVSLSYRIGISYPEGIADVALSNEPVTISEKSDLHAAAMAVGWRVSHGSYDADKIAIIPEHLNLWRIEGGRPVLKLGRPLSRFGELLGDSSASPAVSHISGDSRLQLAIELYNSCTFGLPLNARLVTLVTVLEAIIPSVEIPKHAQRCLKDAKTVIKAHRDTLEKDSVGYHDIEHLLSRVGMLKWNSIGTALQAAIAPVANRDTALRQFADVSGNLRTTYDLRSALLHNGAADPDKVKESLKFLSDFVPKLLTALSRPPKVPP